MKITMMVAATVLFAMQAQAREKFAVYVQNGAVVPERTLRRAEGLASAMFARLDVQIDWRIGRPNHEAVTVNISENSTSVNHPGTLAFALPYEGVHITVFYDRIHKTYAADVEPALLAHVLVHEIAHILEGIERHSETGIMKAHWTEAEISQMPLKPLSFAPYDVSLIQSAITVRAQNERR
jgi:hypothetical protein